ncbi:MAG TPA: PQQ-binding-like beta-propeller repeat protein [Acidimicrobiales bacterium]
MVRNWMSSGAARAIAAVATVATLAGVAISSGASTSKQSSTNWTVYHGDAAGMGASSALRAVDTARRAWTSPALNGKIYGEPLVYNDRVYVATENDYAYALSSTNGRVVWTRHLATPVPSSDLPCGDIAPTVGVTGTPVIDPSRNEIYFVADELVGGVPEHKLIGLNTSSGALELSVRVDPSGSVPSALLQRTGLNLTNGRVVFGMGGNDGDCASYQGRVGSVAESGSAALFYTVDARSGDSQGAVWMGGAAPVVNAHGDVWVSTGNGSVHTNSQAYDDSDSALDLTPTMRLIQFFAPVTWAQDNASDLDMATAPVLLSSGQVVLAGKSPRVYLLNGSHLGGIGHPERTVTGLCNNVINGGSAVVGSTVFLPCLSGPVAVRTTANPASLKLLWRASVGGGPPIYAAGLVWTIGQNGVLYGLNPSNGQVRQQANIGIVANHFPTPSVGDSLLLVPTVDQVVAFRGTPN